MFRLLASVLRMTGEIAVVESIAQTVRGLAIDAALAAIAGLAAIAMLACLAASLWIWGEAAYGPIIAPLLVAGALAVIALVCVLAMARPKRRKTTSTRRAVRAASDQALEPVRLAGAAARGFVQGLAGEPAHRR
jgi:fatty acid desaturase